VLLAIDTFVVEGETKSAAVTVPGGRILHLPGGDMQVLEQEPAAGDLWRRRPDLRIGSCPGRVRKGARRTDRPDPRSRTLAEHREARAHRGPHSEI
jgi:hypothetical protein